MKNKNIFLVFSVLFFVSLASCKGKYSDSKVKVVTPLEMQTLLKMDNVQLLDVRTPKEYSRGCIANAQNIDYFSPTFDEDIKKLDKQKPVIVYCKSGRRSAKSSEKLIDAGFVKIYDLEGGMDKWKHEGFQINKQ